MDTLPEDSVKRGSDAGPASADHPAAEHGARAAVRAGAGSGADSIKPLTAEIRSQMAELVARELALREREHDLERQYRQFQREAREAARQEWVQAQDRLRQRSDELDAQAIELAARGNRLKDREERLSEREAVLERTRQAAAQQIERLRQRSEARRQLRQNDHQLLRQRIAVVRQHEKELERRILLAREDIVGQRDELEQKGAALQARVAALKASANELQVRKAGLQREVAELQEMAKELDARDAELSTQRAEIHDQRHELDQVSRGLEAQRLNFLRKQQELVKRWRSGRAQRREVARQAEELDARHRLLDEQEAAQEQRRQRLENYEQQLRGRAATLESETQRLAQCEEELNERRSSLDALAARAKEILQDAEQRDEEAVALREQAEARDAESRQRQLAAELEAEELGRQRAVLEQAQGELDGERARREAEFTRVRTELAQQTLEIRRAQRRILARPRRWWLRSSVLAVAAGLMTGLAWLGVERPTYRATAELRVMAATPLRPEATLVHEQRLRAPTVVERVLARTGLTGAWQAAQQSGRTHILSQPQDGRVCVSADGPQPASLRRLVGTLTSGYAAAAGEWTESPQAAAAATRLRAERQQLKSELEELRRQQGGWQERLESLAQAAARDAARARGAQLRADYQEQGAALKAARTRLADLEATPSVRGSVLPADYENALLADEMYQADLKEFQGTAGQYRSELATAMLLVVDPPRNLHAVLGTFDKTLAEQRSLQPPASVAAVLEQCTADVSAFGERLKSFSADWAAAIAAVQTPEPERDVVTLVKQQNASAAAVHQLCQEAATFENGLRTRLDELSTGSDGGTREVVVAAVVRGELGRISAAITALAQAAENIDLSKNFRLDALDRQLRGLQERLERRQASVRQILQFEADEQVRREHAERVSELRTSVQEAERRREQLIGELSGQLDELRRLDEEVARRQELEATLHRAGQDIAELEQRLAEIDEQLAAAQQGGTTPGVEAGEVRLATIAGGQRHRHAAFVGGGVLVAVYALCGLMLVRNPWRRRPDWEKALLDAAAGSEREEGSGDNAGA